MFKLLRINFKFLKFFYVNKNNDGGKKVVQENIY